jgi:sigma-B regulation protein RsbU (phosphoserine phosphatase)
VQQSVLPRVFPLAAGYAFAACNQPARSVGGDLYDVFWAGPGQIGLVIADVSGKGMPAALYMALTRSLLLAEARRERSPRAVLLSVNQLLRELGDPHMFVTVFYGLVDAASGRLTYARAGHDYPLLLRDGAATPLGGQGIVLGCFDSDEISLSEEQIVLRPGDQLALYTDGLTDVFGADGERFGPERLAELFCAHAGRGPAELCEESFAALATYQGEAEQFDDMTLLVVGVGG